MSDIKLKSSGDATEFADGTAVKLTAEVPEKAEQLKWLLNETPIEVAGKEHTFTMGVPTDGEYRVTAVLDGKPIESNRLTVKRAVTDEAPSIFYPTFSWVTGVGTIIVGVLIGVALLLFVNPVFADAAWKDLEGRLKVAIALALPATIIGGALVLFGVWMTMVEWRGRLKNPPKEGKRAAAAEGAAGLIEAATGLVSAVGNLKGAALALVVGALLIFGTLWVAQSAASNPGPAATPAPTPTPAAPAGEPGGPTPTPPG